MENGIFSGVSVCVWCIDLSNECNESFYKRQNSIAMTIGRYQSLTHLHLSSMTAIIKINHLFIYLYGYSFYRCMISATIQIDIIDNLWSISCGHFSKLFTEMVEFVFLPKGHKMKNHRVIIIIIIIVICFRCSCCELILLSQ